MGVAVDWALTPLLRMVGRRLALGVAKRKGRVHLNRQAGLLDLFSTSRFRLGFISRNHEILADRTKEKFVI